MPPIFSQERHQVTRPTLLASFTAHVSIGLLVGLLCVLAAAPVPASEFRLRPGRHIVFFRPTPTPAHAKRSRSAWMKAKRQATHRNLTHLFPRQRRGGEPTLLWAVEAVALSLDPDELVTLRRNPLVAEIVPVVRRRWLEPPVESPLDSPFDPEEPGLASEPPSFWAVPLTRAPEAWNSLGIDGSGIVVGHLDSGVFADHPALRGQVVQFRDFTATGAPIIEPYDDQGHGTHTAGSIVGTTDTMGMAPGAQLLVARVIDTDGFGTNEGIMAAMQWMLDPDNDPDTDDGPRVVSNSWGSSSTTDRVFWQMVQTWVDAGIVPVFSGGNNGWQNGRVGVPAAFPHALAVGATDRKDDWAWFSSIGPAKWGGKTYVKPDLVAPGARIWSAGFLGGNRVLSGTSMAAPHVAGLVALLLQANPDLTVSEITSILRETALDRGPTGPDEKYGFGRIDAMAAVTQALGQTSPAGRVRSLLGQAYQPTPGRNERLDRVLRRLPRWAATLDDGTWQDLAASLRHGSPLEQRALHLMAITRRFRGLHRDHPPR
jgi:subtilisin family serine protease